MCMLQIATNSYKNKEAVSTESAQNYKVVHFSFLKQSIAISFTHSLILIIPAGP